MLFEICKKLGDDVLYNRFIKDFHDSIGDHTLVAWGRELATDNDKAFPVEHTGNLFKLYSLYSYLIFPYLHIMPNQRARSQSPFKLIYLDLFAGNGLNRIETNKREYYVCGSPILTLLASFLMSQRRRYSCYFDQMILIDQKKENVALLSQRINCVAKKLNIDSVITVSNKLEDRNSNVTVTKADVTDDRFVQILIDVINKIWTNNHIHVMLFIDPDAPRNLKMQTLKEMLKFPGDLLMLLHPGIFAEMTMKKRYNEKTLMSMLGIDRKEAESLMTERQEPAVLSEYYVKKYEAAIKGTPISRLKQGGNKREVVIKVHISTKQSSYLLIYATRETGGNSSVWQKPFANFANWIGKQSDAGELALHVLTGHQSSLDHFSL
jgi:three-Cys-motif partner protein